MKIVMIGHGGHSKVIRDLIYAQSDYEFFGYLDDKYSEARVVDNIFYGPISSVSKLVEYFLDIKFIIAIGNNKVRKKMVQKLNLSDQYYLTLIHPSAVVSSTSKIGAGSVIMPNSVINADSEIGKHSIINTGAVVEHDSKIGNFIHISPGATLTGTVYLEDGVNIGAGATIIPNIIIGKWAIIGAGATVIDHIPSFCTAVGIPAKVNKVNKDGGEVFVKYHI